MAPEPSGNIRVFVRWHDQTVFAGEEIRCTITFKNVAPTPGQQQGSINNQQQGSTSHHERGKGLSALSGRAAKATAGLTPPPSATLGRGHRRSALSMSVPPSSSRASSGSIQWPQGGNISEGRPSHMHKRSVSIVSIGSTSTIDDLSQRHETGPPRAHQNQRPSHGHNRSSSLQIVPRDKLSPPLGSSEGGGFSHRQNMSSALHGSYPPRGIPRSGSASSIPNGPGLGGRRKSSRTSPNPMPEFRFPAAPPPPSESDVEPQDSPENGLLRPKNNINLALRQRDQSIDVSEPRTAPATRILSNNSIGTGTPRSSGEFYSMSNHSSETLASEYVTQQQPARGQRRPPHLRRSSGLVPQTAKGPESLMMGYVQVHGSFVLDGSLVSLAPFDQVKKRAVVGGRGGGVVGLEQTKRESGMLRGFGWSNISTSLGDLLGGGDLSTIKEMREVASSKSVPLLNTPQSILFVDLQLAPGESQAFEYSFKLPKGLPPTHKGKAVKIAYNIMIGTQRAGGAKEQQVRSVEVPFKVLGSVNRQGEILGHDLMNPHILLRDEARVEGSGKARKHARKSIAKNPIRGATLNEFLMYADELVNRPREETGGAVLSPSAVAGSRRPSVFEDGGSAPEAIHMAIMRSNVAGENQQSPNRFEIARNGQRVGVIMLTRPAYRLGEAITMAIDFSDADVPCYAVHTTLETSEKVDQSLAVRSESSIQRVTRKVYVTSSQATLYSRRIVFTPTIPITATPDFVTSGVSFEWKIRVEFVMPSQGADASSPGPALPHPLLEKISQDEKGGLVLVAAENLLCESFDVTVPLRVYGAVGTGLERLERDEALEEGLVI